MALRGFEVFGLWERVGFREVDFVFVRLYICDGEIYYCMY